MTSPAATSSSAPSTLDASVVREYHDKQCADMHESNSIAEPSFTGSPEDKAEQYLTLAQSFGAEMFAKLTLPQRQGVTTGISDYFAGRC